LELHHIGYVVREIDPATKRFPGLRLAARLVDPLQNAELALFECGGVFLEFIKPLGEGAFTWQFLNVVGGGYHHLCFAVENLEEAQRYMHEGRLTKIRGPMPAVLFGGKLVLFAMNRNKEIIEFLISGS